MLQRFEPADDADVTVCQKKVSIMGSDLVVLFVISGLNTSVSIHTCILLKLLFFIF